MTIIEHFLEDQLENPLFNEMSHHELQQMDKNNFLVNLNYNSSKITRKKVDKWKRRKGAKDGKKRKFVDIIE